MSNKRAVIIECSPEIALYLRANNIRLPRGVAYAAEQESFERATTLVRLEGDGLPDAAIVQPGMPYAKAMLDEQPDKSMTVVMY